MKTPRKTSSEIEEKFPTLNHSLHYKIVLMVSAKVVDGTVKGCLYLNMGAINCPNNIRKI